MYSSIFDREKIGGGGLPEEILSSPCLAGGESLSNAPTQLRSLARTHARTNETNPISRSHSPHLRYMYIFTSHICLAYMPSIYAWHVCLTHAWHTYINYYVARVIYECPAWKCMLCSAYIATNAALARVSALLSH